MVINKEDILTKLKNLKEELKTNYKVKTIGLFGSYVKNTQKDASDIDFLVEFEDNADLFHFIGLSNYLEEIFDTKVDVISKPSLKEDLKQHILQEVIYE
ncbi:MAG: nucleotidyltransferase family protein [Candidatus Lokiarchaeota archaeon]|nr:nucleotidyltransferase family protein [Candidatus Lokiarchaeota archaeon]